ncbi:MAG: Rne/Rng family ribonuclease [Gemmatimonadetes bacterium]|nr:Rne/Rng family ribonuclease [Gemmatimonadota bacterium]
MARNVEAPAKESRRERGSSKEQRGKGEGGGRRRRGGRGRGSGGSGGGSGSSGGGGRRRGGRRPSGSPERRQPAGAGDTYREIVVNAEGWQTRVATLEDGQLVEYMIERPDQRRIVGDVFKGKVTAILPGIQAAFLDIGLEKGAFLHVSDLSADLDSLDLDDEENGGGSRNREPSKRLPIEDQIKKGDELLVQVMKEPIGTKGPRVTAQVTLPGRFVVLMPGMDHIGVSRKIEERSERSRLRDIIKKHRPEGCGVITRTVGSGEPEEAFANDIRYLHQTWEKIQRDSAKVSAPALIHQDMTLTTGLIRDVFSDDFDRLIVDDSEEYDRILEYVESISPDLADRIELYEDEIPIFDAFDIEPELEKTLHRKVWMKKGGYLCIDQAEALIAIDINTGRFKGKSDQEETILRCNLEAAKEIPRQLRLRDIGGLVVIDFIDMASEENRSAVLEELRRNLKRDRARTKTFPVSELGLVEMTRQRVRPAMSSYYSVECPECGGAGQVLSEQTLLAKVERIVRRVGRSSLMPRLEVRVHPKRADFLLEEGFDRIAQLENRFDLAVDIREDRELHHDDVRVFDDRGKEITARFG